MSRPVTGSIRLPNGDTITTVRRDVMDAALGRTQDQDAANRSGVRSVQWYPGADRSEGNWHVVLDGWKHLSSHPTKEAALAALDGTSDPDPGA